MRYHKHQTGQALIATVLALALISGLLGIWFVHAIEHYYDQLADVQGAALAEYGVGIRGYIANVQGGSATMPSNPYTVGGVNWLKAPTCGGLAGNPAQGYVPCDFTGGPLGQTFTTTITQTPATNAIRSSTWFFASPKNGSALSSRADMAAKIAFAALAQQNLPINGMFLSVFSNAPSTATAQPSPSAIAAADRGRVVLVADNAPSNDIWLRVDGTNKMLANLNMGGHSVTNAQNGDFSGYMHVQGTEEVDNGLTVKNGPVDAQAGVSTTDTLLTSINRFATQGIYDAQVFTGAASYNVTKPNCSQAHGGSGSQAAIYAALQGTGSPEGQADAIWSAGVKVTDNGSFWTVTPQLSGTSFSLSGSQNANSITINLNKSKVTLASVPDQVVLVETKCR